MEIRKQGREKPTRQLFSLFSFVVGRTRLVFLPCNSSTLTEKRIIMTTAVLTSIWNYFWGDSEKTQLLSHLLALRSRPSSRGVKDGRFQSCRDSSSRAPDSLRGRYIRGLHANARQPVRSYVFRSRDLYTIGQSVFQSLSWAPRCEACCEDVE